MSSGRSELPGRRFVPRVEALEDRTVPSGDVSVTIVKGVLTVTGDAAGNIISIAGAGKNSVVIRSLDGTTTFNGGANSVSLGGIKHGYNINLNGGDDFVLVSGTRAKGDLNVNLGDGNDVLGVTDTGHKGATNLFGGNGNDFIALANAAFKSYLYVDTGAGDDSIATYNVAAGPFGARNTAGNDYFSAFLTTLGAPVVLGFAPGVRPAPPVADTAAPVATLSSTAPATTNAPITFTATFNEDVGLFGSAGVTVVNGTVTSFSQADARTYTFVVSPTGQGTVSATVAAGAAFDAAANPSVVSNTVSRTFDSVAPVLTINSQSTNDSTPTLTGTVDDPNAAVTVTVSGQVLTATVSGNTWSATVPTALADGSYTVSVTGTDAAGNVGSASQAGALVVSTVPPSFTATTPPTANFNSGAQAVSNFATFTKAPNGPATPTYTVSSVSNPGLFSVPPAVAANGTLSYTPVTGGFGSSTFAVSVSDGINSSPTQTFTITVDAVQGATATIPGISLSDARWMVTPTVVPAGNSAGIPAGTVPDGTRILDEMVGTGAIVTSGDSVNVTYIGYLLDGTIFDQNTATFSTNGVIPGFAAGLLGMQTGGTRDIDISSYLAYGNNPPPPNPPKPPIPANARLVFKVTLNSITP